MKNGFESIKKDPGYSSVMRAVFESGCPAPEELVLRARTLSRQMRALKKNLGGNVPEQRNDMQFKLLQQRNEIDRINRLARNTVNYVRRELAKAPR